MSITTELLKAVLIATIPLLLPFVGQVFLALRGYIEAKTRQEWLKIILHEAFDVVQATGQVMIDPVKRALNDGHLSAEEQADLKAIALKTLTDRLRDVPVHLFPDLLTRASQAIESAVAGTKTTSPLAGGSVLVSQQASGEIKQVLVSAPANSGLELK